MLKNIKRVNVRVDSSDCARDQTASLLPGSPAPEMAVVEELSPTPGPLASFPSLFVPVDFKSSLDEAF